MEEFFSRTKICFGKDALQYLKHYRDSRCFIVADPFLIESGMIEQITAPLKGGQYEVFSHVVPDPPLELVAEGIQAVQSYEPEVVIAVGGGSAIDEAKAIRYFAKRTMTFVAVPTTSGTGSEVTSFAVLTDKSSGAKYPLVDEALKPEVAILDPVLVKSVPPAIVADTGMDVLTHAIEAYVSNRANAFTDALAQKAALLVFRYLHASYEDSQNREARAMMHYASCLAGIAFDRASLGLNHAISHNISGKFHISHGRTNAILLPHVMEFNAALTDYHQKNYTIAAEKYAELADMAGCGGMNVRISVKNLMTQIRKLQKQLGLPTTLRECGVKASMLEQEMEGILIGTIKDTCIRTNPRNTVQADIRNILKKVL